MAAVTSTAGFCLCVVLGFCVGLSFRISKSSNFWPLFLRYSHNGMNKIMAMMVRQKILIIFAMNFAMAIYSCVFNPH